METSSTINSLILLVQQSFNYLPTQEELANRTLYIAKGLGINMHEDDLIKLIESEVPFQMNIEGLKWSIKYYKH